MSDSFPTIRVAAIQASPVFLDRERTAQKACDLILEAGRNGAEYVVFPEGYIPAHPCWYHHHTATGSLANGLAIDLFKNAVTISGPAVTALCAAAKKAGVFVVMGVCEKLADTFGTMYNTQVFISREGEFLGKHQKFMPTVGERLVHAGGHGDTFGTFKAHFGTVSALVCGENTNPLAMFALTSENTCIHGMSWPNYFALTAPPMRNLVIPSSQAFAIISGAFVVSACGVIDEPMLDKMSVSSADREILADPAYTGGSVIISSDGSILGEAANNQEQILYADCDFNITVRAKLRVDFAGHYNRPDIFQLRINRSAPVACYPAKSGLQAALDGAAVANVPEATETNQTDIV